MTVSPSDLEDQLLELAVSLAAAAADRHRAGNSGGVDTKSTDTDPVTEVDRDAEALIVEGILARRPDDTIHGEEGASIEGTSGVEWVIDPLDGTVNFVYGFPQYAVSIGVLVDGVPTVGVIHDTVADAVYSAVRGRGAWCDGVALQVSACDTVASTLMATGFAYEPEARRRHGAVLAELIADIRDIRRAGSAALDLCHVAAGRVDAYYESGPNLWDVVAGMLIVVEAGGHADYDPVSKRILAAADGVAEALSERIALAEQVAHRAD